MSAIWSLVPLPFLKPAWTSKSSRFMYLAWRILSITLLACEMSAIVCSLNILWHWMKCQMKFQKKWNPQRNEISFHYKMKSQKKRNFKRNESEKKVKSLSGVQLFVTPWTVACTRLLHPWDFLGKSTGVGCHLLLQGIFPTQRLNPGLLHCRQTPRHLSHQGSR